MTEQIAGVVELRSVTRTFGDVTAVRELSCTVAEGEVLGLLGHNGAGKTTTLRLIDGVLAATQGSVRVFGMDPRTHGADVRRRCGVLLSQPALDRRLTGRENLDLAARLHGLAPDGADARITELTTSFHLDDRLDDRVEHYSAGMAQRLVLARMLLPDPSLLLLDEPTAALDPMAAHGVRQLISDLARAQSRTVITSTHDLIEAARLCDRVVVLQRGRLVALGTPEELFRRIAARGLRLRVAERDGARVRGIAAELSYAIEPLGDGLVQLHGVGYDDVPPLVRALVDADVDVYGVTVDKPTLTDFYLALHSDDPDDPLATADRAARRGRR